MAWALGRFDGTALYEHSDPNRGEQLDWGTYVFDFGRAEVRNFLVGPTRCIGLQDFHIDGLRVDAGRLDAVPRLFAGRWVAGRRMSTAAGRTSKPCSSCRR